MKINSFLALRRLKTLWLSFILVLTGYLISESKKTEYRKNHYRHHIQKGDYCMVVIQDEPEEKEKSIKVLAEVVSILKHNEVVTSSGEALLYFKKTVKSKNLKCGDQLLIPNRFSDIKNSGNPGAFDYGTFCRSQGIDQSAYLKDNDVQVITKQLKSPSWLKRMSNGIKTKMTTYIPDPKANGMAIALLIGYRKGIDNDTYQAYASTGLMHLIAISGMHIGMIYLTIQFFLQLIPWIKHKIRIRLFIALLALWTFAIMIGLPPSVYRSAVMFTLIGVGEMFKRKIQIYNSLACSAFILLCQYPAWIMDIGFQLSYLAVLSIAVCYPKIYTNFYFKNAIIDKIWQTIAVTIAAQILTFPLCIYYFHQFPLLFIINNLIGIFFTTMIIYGEIIMLMASMFPCISLMLGKCITGLILLLNQLVMNISKAEQFIWSGIQINQFQVLLLFLVIIFFIMYKKNRKPQVLIVTLCFCTGLSLSLLLSRLEHLQQKKFIVYCSHNQSILGFIAGNQCHYIIGEGKADAKKLYRYVFHPSNLYFMAHQSGKDLVGQHLFQSSALLLFNRKVIVRMNDDNIGTTGPFNSDFLVLSNGNFNNILNTVNQFGHPTVIFDSSLPEWKAIKYQEILAKSGILSYIVSQNGAFISDL